MEALDPGEAENTSEGAGWDDDLLDMAGPFSGLPGCCRANSASTVAFAGRRRRAASGAAALFDSHCHVGSDREQLGLLPRVKCSMLVFGTSEADWPGVQSACSSARSSAPGFGLHPWYAHSAQEGWLDRLRALLEAQPRALVGEIGLDKVYRTKETRKCEFQAQLAVFEAQLRLAHALRRPASVHCVQSWGKMMEVLQVAAAAGALPPAIAVHSWGGPPEWMEQLSRAAGPQCPLYFGFSDVVNYKGGDAIRAKRLEENIRAVPDGRLLLESDIDAPDMVDEGVSTMCNVIAKLKA